MNQQQQAVLFGLVVTLVFLLVIINLRRRFPLVPAIAGAVLFLSEFLAYQELSRGLGDQAEVSWHGLQAILWLGVGIWGILTYLKGARL